MVTVCLATGGGIDHVDGPFFEPKNLSSLSPTIRSSSPSTFGFKKYFRSWKVATCELRIYTPDLFLRPCTPTRFWKKKMPRKIGICSRHSRIPTLLYIEPTKQYVQMYIMPLIPRFCFKVFLLPLSFPVAFRSWDPSWERSDNVFKPLIATRLFCPSWIFNR